MVSSGIFSVQMAIHTAFVSLLMGVANAKPPCELGQFLQHESASVGICEPCSKCQVNEIIREPCTTDKDTVCGPFYEFEFFNQGSSWSEGEDKHKDKNINLFKLLTTRGPGEPQLHTDGKQLPVGPSVQDETVRWKELCYGLITALVLLAIVFAAYVVIAHIQISRLRAKAKAQAQESSDEETIYCYTHMLPSFCHKPKPSSSARSQGVLTPIYRPGQARRTSPPIRATPNEYILQVGGARAESAVGGSGEVQQQLLPVIPEVGGASEEADLVQVLYTRREAN